KAAEQESPETKAARNNIARTPAPSPFARHADGRPVRATMINVRHWTVSEVTRISIELDAGARYQAGVVPDPDRLFFDVQNTRLDHGLLGRTIEVNDGLVKRIRVAPYRADLARVVLELDTTVD